MYLIVTIDTEEDNWGEYNLLKYSLKNIEEIPKLQDLFDEFNVKPTYLITYPVATNENSIKILKKILDEGKCEIGTHCHPWNTPPLIEVNNKKNTFLCNLPYEVQYEKIKNLKEEINKNFGIKPISFRAGRWGFNEETALVISKLGFKIDSSITPYTAWTENHSPNFKKYNSATFKIKFAKKENKGHNDEILEVPVTIEIIMNIFGYKSLSKWKFIDSNNLKFLSRIRILKKIWLSPELTTLKEMVNLSKLLMKNDLKILNMTFHSSSLVPGLNKFIKNEDNLKDFYNKIRNYLKFCKEYGIKSITLSETLNLFD